MKILSLAIAKGYRPKTRGLGAKHLDSSKSNARPSSQKLAYLVSQYPKVSHSFIRREILALEKRGWQICRLSIRGWDADLVDQEDILEQAQTRFVLKGGAFPLILATLRQILLAPRRFLTSLALAVRMMPRSDRPFLWHLIYLAEACWIAPQLTMRGIKHMHAHFGTNPAEVAMLVSELTGISYSFTVHGYEEYHKARSIHLAEKIRRAVFVVAVCSFGRGQIFRVIDPQDWDKIKVIHCGIDETFADLDFVVPSETNRLVCVGRLCDEKGQLFLVKTVTSLVKEGRKFELILVGDGEHRAAIEQMIAENNLANIVTVTGWADANQVKEEILKARALILPSFVESLPVVLMEAMALGRPVLSTYVGGIPELVINGETGWLFPAGSEEKLLEAIRICLDTPHEALSAMGTSARARALKRHNINDQAEELTRLFRSALRGRQK
jgi:colanic acid/amylovoran biosynthesis glycosyltransferase